MKKFSSVKRQTSDKRLGVIVCFAFLFLYQETLVLAQNKSQPEPPIVLSSKNRLEPLPCPERKTTNFSGRLTAHYVLSESIPDYLSNEGVALTYKMAQGKYDEVIEAAQKELQNNFPWWEGASWEYGGEKDHIKIAEMLRLMANAYELKGDWENAFRAYRVLLGELSEDYQWVLLRRRFIENENNYCREVFSLAWEFSEEDGENVNRLVEAIEKDRKEYAEDLEELHSKYPDETLAREFKVPANLMPTWRRVWTFRDRSVRTLCPEIYYTTSLFPQEGIECFPELQKKNFERLTDMLYDYYLSRKLLFDRKSAKNIVNFMRVLDSIPYDLAPDGKYYENSLEGGRSIPGKRGNVQPAFWETH